MIDQIDSLLARVLSKEADVDDMLHFAEWYNSDENNKKEFQALKSFWMSQQGTGTVLNAELAFEKFRQHMIRIQRRKTIMRRILPIAVSIVLLLSAGLYFLRTNTNSNPRDLHYNSYVSETGTARVVLSDGTLVHLNRNSQLRYADSYGSTDRVVELDGEAYFDVKKSEQEFKIRMGQAEIKVFGTQFNVNAHANDSIITATLVNGSIAFSNNTREVRMNPNEQLVYNKLNDDYTLSRVEANMSTSWKEGVYKFSAKPMDGLCKDLEKIYGVKIILDPKYKNIEMSGSFEYKLRIDEVLTILRRSVPYNFKIQDSTITITE